MACNTVLLSLTTVSVKCTLITCDYCSLKNFNVKTLIKVLTRFNMHPECKQYDCGCYCFCKRD